MSKPITKSTITKQGVVVSDKMQKTIVVEVERKYRHPIYRKTIRRTKHYKAHDELNKAKIGYEVEISQCRPISRDKTWILSKIVKIPS